MISLLGRNHNSLPLGSPFFFFSFTHSSECLLQSVTGPPLPCATSPVVFHFDWMKSMCSPWWRARHDLVPSAFPLCFLGLLYSTGVLDVSHTGPAGDLLQGFALAACSCSHSLPHATQISTQKLLSPGRPFSALPIAHLLPTSLFVSLMSYFIFLLKTSHFRKWH